VKKVAGKNRVAFKIFEILPVYVDTRPICEYSPNLVTLDGKLRVSPPKKCFSKVSDKKILRFPKFLEL
jgi:hypothetical protein